MLAFELVLIHNANGKWYHWIIFEDGKSFAFAREFDSPFSANTESHELIKAFGVSKIRVEDST